MPKRIPFAETVRSRAGRVAADRARSGSRDPFYNRAAWKRLRAWFIAQPGHAVCAECKRGGRLVPAVVVDHIVPRQHDRSLELDPSNLQALCRACDNRKRAKDNARGLSGRRARGSVQEDSGPRVRDLMGGDGA